MQQSTNIDFGKISRILTINVGGIGNLILFTPVLRALRRHCPGSYIALMTTEPGIDGVVTGSGLVDEVILCDTNGGQSLISKLQFVRKMRKRAFDLAIVATGANALNGSLLTFLMGIPYRVGENVNGRGLLYTTRIRYEEQIHELDGNMNLIKAMGVHPVDEKPTLSISTQDALFAEGFFRDHGLFNNPSVTMHIGPLTKEKEFKTWPHTSFLELANKLIDIYEARIILIGGRDEAPLAECIAKDMRQKPAMAVAKATIGQTAALLQRSHLFISSDSGPMHMAAAVGTPVVALFGPTDPKKVHPWGDNYIVIKKDLDCRPCYHRARVKCKDFDCFRLITVEEVLVAADELLRKNKQKRREFP